MQRRWLVGLLACAWALVVVATASGTKPGSGLSTGVGSVFVPNPVQQLGDETLTDQKDSDAAVPASAYHGVSEGFGDYWAVTVGDIVRRADRVATLEPLACVADWDSTSYTSDVPHCLRRLDDNLHYPGDLDGDVHDDGRIWSQALLDIRNALNPTEADTIIVEGSMNFLGTTMPQLAQATVNTAQALYGNSAKNAVFAAFHARGIL